VPLISLRLPAPLDRAIREVAAREGVSVSTLVRSAISSKFDDAGVVVARSPSIEETLARLDRTYEERGWADVRLD
jgi:hypothetical protein